MKTKQEKLTIKDIEKICTEKGYKLFLPEWKKWYKTKIFPTTYKGNLFVFGQYERPHGKGLFHYKVAMFNPNGMDEHGIKRYLSWIGKFPDIAAAREFAKNYKKNC